MTQAVARILEEAGHLSIAERAELTDRLVEGLAQDVPAHVGQAQIAEVRLRIAEAEANEALLIPGEEAMANIWRLVAAARAAK